MSCIVIRHVHRLCGATDPIASETVRQVRRGLVRTYGAAPRRLARPLTVDEIRLIIRGIDRTTPIGIRDAAIILLGYASALRRAEIVASPSPTSSTSPPDSCSTSASPRCTRKATASSSLSPTANTR